MFCNGTKGILAQLGEHLPYKQRVIGSSPIGPIWSEKGSDSRSELGRVLAPLRVPFAEGESNARASLFGVYRPDIEPASLRDVAVSGSGTDRDIWRGGSTG